ncbi:hypothetical protein [Streptomyces sp. CoT10]|uniref:hypothetical protein n=1 Tax=Streptomyces sp. CoT10 TaxID=2875762 RepID=UPI001CD6AF18|nr:hypothetical protein [Streptomyces sp. CoT10]
MAKEISGLAGEATECYSLWIRGRTVAEIAAEKGLSVQQAELRISRARTSKAELAGVERLTDVGAILDDAIRQAQEALHWGNGDVTFADTDMPHKDRIAYLEFITNTAMKKAELYGLLTGGSDAVPDFEEME